jgi:hypothetical protein
MPDFKFGRFFQLTVTIGLRSNFPGFPQKPAFGRGRVFYFGQRSSAKPERLAAIAAACAAGCFRGNSRLASGSFRRFCPDVLQGSNFPI